ncbi:DUF6279 family lipoprotein [Hydrogenophaga palleronii]|uniref:DUF6279 family lipoprotein n=1 Tax=Hydrogenophaga palleronii TaxID=65655 RepID=UPI0012EEC497|nr:DUF6279 family lipoprotein [Hydrogenophaga palleronii]
MNTSCKDGLHSVLAGHHPLRIIARRVARPLALLGMCVVLAACTTTRLAYNQAPTLSYWWIHRHVDLNDTQTAQTREDLKTFFQWHRSQELPAYASLLQQWQAMATDRLTPAQACTQLDDIRARLDRVAEEAVEPLARLARRLSPEQLEHLKQRQARSNADFEKDFLRGSPEQRLNKRLDKAVERSESFYGTLSTAQRELLRELLQTSPFDPQRTQSERLRRQADLLQTVRDVQASPARAEQLVREHIDRIRQSPDPAYQAYSEALLRQSCNQFAALHNSTTAEQRASAVRALKAYEDDFRTLHAQR